MNAVFTVKRPGAFFFVRVFDRGVLREDSERAKREFSDALSLGGAKYSIGKEPGGKPFLTAEGENKEYSFVSVTHTKNVFIAAAASCPIGIDAEFPPSLKRAERIAERYFSPAEKEKLKKAADEEAFTKLFARIWTKKEAYSKFTGEGLSAALAADTEGIFEGTFRCEREALPEKALEALGDMVFSVYTEKNKI